MYIQVLMLMFGACCCYSCPGEDDRRERTGGSLALKKVNWHLDDRLGVVLCDIFNARSASCAAPKQRKE